jgi:uncharacterized protein (TIGR02145 family)
MKTKHFFIAVMAMAVCAGLVACKAEKEEPEQCPDFNPGVIATGRQTVCSGDAVNTITSSIDASGGDGNITYRWRRNGSPIDGANTATYNPAFYNTTAGTHTFTRWACDNCNTSWTQSAGRWVLVVQAKPELTLTTANNNQTVGYDGAAITPIKYITTNTSSVILNNGSFPSGISGSWANNTYTISGSPNTTGTFNYAITACHTNGCTSNSASGAITVNGVAPPPAGAASTQTWVIGTQTWSAPLTKAQTGCTASTFFNYNYGGYTGKYRSSGLYPGSGYLYNWKCMHDQAENLCPYPWRVPTADDFCELYKSLIGESHCAWANNPAVRDRLIATTGPNAWSGVYGGYAEADSVAFAGREGTYWSNSKVTVNEQEWGALIFSIYGTSCAGGTCYTYKNRGLQVRCVK